MLNPSDSSGLAATLRSIARQRLDIETAPSTLYRPEIQRGKNVWIAVFGDVRGYGASPQEAFQNFDQVWFGAVE